MEKHNQLFKDLITGLFYPAIFGTIIYTLIECLYKHVSFCTLLHIVCNLTWVGTFKLLLILVLTVFYTCDFLYTMYSDIFKRWYFAADFGILTGLYIIFKHLHYGISRFRKQTY